MYVHGCTDDFGQMQNLLNCLSAAGLVENASGSERTEITQCFKLDKSYFGT